MGATAAQGTGAFAAASGAIHMIGWAALQGRWLDGGVDGTTRELTFGMDFEVGTDTRLGLFLSAGRADLQVGGIDIDSDALSFGPYFKTRLGPASPMIRARATCRWILTAGAS